MAKANPPIPDTRPTPKDPRTISALDNLGVDRPGDLLDADLDDQPADDGPHRNFADDVRSDSYDDERHERR